MIEPRSSQKVDEVWKEYQKSITEDISSSSSGAILLCVAGGKLSEGINFSDGLGRCVIVVGLPYPNPNDPIIAEKMKYFNTLQSSLSTSKKHSLNGNEFYENLCMRTVNQSIGRSIRHSKDFATVLLIDKRFSQSKITSKLPKWMCSNLITDSNFPSMLTTFAKFFQAKRSAQSQLNKE